MKKRLLTLFMLVATTTFMSAQDDTKGEASNDTEETGENYNRWTVEVSAGQAKGIKPYATGFYSSSPQKFFGGVQANSFGVAARYMFGPIFGMRLGLNYDKFTNQNDSGSLDFETSQYRGNLEGVVNAARLFDVQEPLGRFGLLLHGGVQVARMKSEVVNESEWNGGIIIGFTPQFRVTKRLALNADISFLNNFRQHFNWDGSYNDPSNNLSGQMSTLSLGLTYSLGKDDMHGDWAIIPDKSDLALNGLKDKVAEIETLMNDSDKDGVPDYLDLEKNSLAGVAVDTKGRMVDKNNNGVPDELEKYVDNSVKINNASVVNKMSDGMVVKLINEGYVAAYFDLDSRFPNVGSTDNLGFILNYLKTNPGKSVEITGYADVTGNTKYNQALSEARAENVKTILVKAGIDASRLTIIANGEDDSVDKTSEYARRLVRKVVFKVVN
jgi:OOP family OmpA-OmpF porin